MLVCSVQCETHYRIVLRRSVPRVSSLRNILTNTKMIASSTIGDQGGPELSKFAKKRVKTK